MDAFNILLEEDIFRTNPQALEKLTGWVNARDAGRQPAAMYAMEACFWQRTTWRELSKWRRTASPNILRAFRPDPFPEYHTTLLDKNRVEDAERLISKYPGTSPGLVFQQGALAFRKGDYPLAQSLFREAARRASEKTAESACSMKIWLR